METKWNLDEILKVDGFENLYAKVEKNLKKIEKIIAGLDPKMSQGEFSKILLFLEEFDEKVARLGYLPMLLESIDSKNARAKKMKSQVDNLGIKISEATLPLSFWIKGKRKPILDNNNAKRLFPTIKQLQYGLEKSREAAKYSLKEPEENIITNKDVYGMGTLGDIREILETEMSYEIKVDGRIKKIKSQSELLALTHSPKKELRKEAYGALLTKQKDNIDKFFLIYQAVVKDWNYERKLRGYKSAIAVRNHGNDIPNGAVESLLAVCEENIEIPRKYFEWKAEKLGNKTLSRFDLYAPLLRKQKKYTISESREIVLSALAKFSPKFYRYGKEMIEGRHIDWLPNENKRGGAYCATVSPKINPYIMLNFTGQDRDLSTLAHELGHGIHSMYANKLLPSAQQATLPLAETASTMAEMILFEEILKGEKDKEIREAMLSDKMADSYATIWRQNYFVMFEKRAFETIPQGISAEELSSNYFQNLNKQFGKSVALNKLFRYEWSYISHIFESPFYCYAYNFGELLSYSLYAKYKEDPEYWKTKIEKILSVGGSDSALQILKDAKIDFRQKKFWQDSMQIVSEWQKNLTG